MVLEIAASMIPTTSLSSSWSSESTRLPGEAIYPAHHFFHRKRRLVSIFQ
jgi:hypothetical protein